MKLNLGAGYHKIPSLKTVDFRKETKPDYLVNLEDKRCLKNIKTNSVTHILASHILEHITNLEQLMEEIYRVCKHNAIMEIIVPYWSHHTAVEDPGHVRYFTEQSMMYFSKTTTGSDGRKFSILYDFKEVSVEFFPTDEYNHLSQKQFKEALKKYLNVAYQVKFILRVNKK